MKLLTIDHLSFSYGDSRIIEDLSLSLEAGSVLGIVGESGSGKTTLLRSVLAVRTGNAEITGTIEFQGRNLLTAEPKELQNIRGNQIAMIPQNAFLAMDQTKTISSLFYETVKVHNRHVRRSQTDRDAAEIMEKLLLENPEQILRSYPFELSGGMCQRVMIAVSMINHPLLLLADEPTSALDGTAQKTVLQELNRLRKDFSVSLILVSHNFGVVAYLADQIAVMKDGQLIESGAKEKILKNPEREYTRELIRAVPKLD